MKNNFSSKAGTVCKKFGGAVKALVATAMIALAGTAWGFSQTIDGVTWNYKFIPDSSDVSIVKGESQPAVSGATGEVTVPSKLGGYTVRRIGQYAFYNCTAVTKVTIPSTVTSIGDHAFYQCSNLARVYFPSTVTEIDGHTFQFCSKLDNVTLPSSLLTLGEYAFNNCSSLTSITVPSRVTTINDYTFGSCSSLKTLKLPYDVTTISATAFKNCSNLETVCLPISFIDSSTDYFSAAPALQPRYCGKARNGYNTWLYQVIKNGSGYCAELRNIEDLRPAVTRTTATSLDIPSTINGYAVKSLGQYAFSQCTKLASVKIPDSVTNIDYCAFSQCYSLKSVSIPKNVKTVGKYAFYYCSGLEKVEFDSSSSSTIANYAFYGCEKLNYVSLPISRLGYVRDALAFSRCASDLMVFYWDNSKHVIAQIKDGQAWYYRLQFQDPYDLSSVQLVSPLVVAAKQTGKVTIPSSFSYKGDTFTVKSLDTQVFSGSGVTEVEIPSTVTNIGNQAFYNCTNLTTVTGGTAVKSIGDYAFYNCANLTAVTIGAAVKNIGSYAFGKCTNLENVYVPDSVEKLGAYAFKNCESLKTASLPGSLYNTSGANTWFLNCPDVTVTYRGLTHKVTFNATANGGTALPLADRAKNVAHGAAVGSMPTPNPPSGYSFTGWFTAASGGERVTTAYIINADVTFYAHYTQTPCKVTFNANGGTVSPTTRLVVKGGQVGTLPTPTRDGYTCNGWWTSPFIGGQKISETQTINADVTFYANWLENHTVTFNANGGTPATTTRVVVHGSTVGKLPAPPTRDGYTFNGWWTTSDGGSQIAPDQTVTENVTYYAHWTLNTVTVTFEPNGGSVEEPTRVIGIGNTIGELPTPSRDNYDFVGWFTLPSDGTQVDASFQVTAEVTFFAQWKQQFLTEEVGGYTWYYVLEGAGTARIYKGAKSPAVEPAPTGLITIPATLGGVDVTTIGGDAFYECSGMTGVVIPATVATIASSAFYKCSGLTSLALPDGLTTIFDSAFSDCTGLTDMTIPASVDDIRNYAFLRCTGLKTVTYVGNCPAAPTEAGKMIYTGTSETLLESIVSATATGWEAALAAGTWQGRKIRAAAQVVTVTFDPTGGSVSPTTKDLTYGGVYGVLPTPTRPNQRFLGWFTAKSDGTEVFADTQVQNSTAHTLYARWAPPTTATVTLDPNGGTVSPESITVPVNSKVGDLPEPTRNGYRFDGWWTEKTGGEQVSANRGVRNSVTFYAHWTQLFTVTFNAAGGTPASTTRTVASGEAVGDLPTPERPDWTFLGWFTAASSGSEISASTTVMGDVTYYAHWKKTNFTVTFDANGGTVSPNTSTVANGAAVGALPTPAWAGNTFQGWFTAASGGTQVSESTTVDSDVTFYAHWKSDSATVTVTFDANGGTVTPATKSVAVDSAVGDLPTPTREDHVFQGWFTAASGGTQVDASTVVSANATFYAQWLASGYSTWTDANGLTWIYRIDDGKAELYNDDKAAISPATVAGSITVPATLGGCPVTRIGDCAFLECPNLERVTIQPGVTSIGDWCFQDSPSLKGVSIPAGVTDLGDQAFSGCTALEGISLPASVTTIGSTVFSDCQALAQVNIPAALLIITECAFADCIATIADSAFVNCANLSSMRIPKTVTSIGIDAFTDSALAVVYVEAGDTARVKGLVEGSGYDKPVTYIEDPVDTRIVTFDPNGGTVFETYRHVEIDEAIGTLPTPEWAGHTFDGWFTAVSGGTQISASTTVSEDVTYYAHWTEEIVEPDPVDPDPVTPDPVTPDPVTPDPVTPDPVTPDPVTPDPVTPDPVTPDPVTPDPVTPDPVTPDPVTPDPVTPDPVTPDPVTPDPVTPDPVTPDPVTPDGPCYVSREAGDIVEPYSAPKVVKLHGVAYSGCDVVGVVELKLGKVNPKKLTSKVSGSFIGLDGKKCTIKATTATSVNGTAPVTVSLVVKNVGTMTVTIGGERFAGSLGAWHVQSADVGGNWTKSGTTVSVDVGGLSAFTGTVLADLLPKDVPVMLAGGKWKCAKATGVKWAKPKRGSAALPEIYDAMSGKGLLVDMAKGPNLSAMKLTYTPKKGTFKGSFKVYALDGVGKATKLKKYTFKMSGVVADGVGYGQATCKRPAVTWAVLVK